MLGTTDLDASAWYDLRVTGPNDARCPERAALAKKLEDAAELVLSGKREYDDLLTSQGEFLRFADALTNARARARAAEHAFEDHVAVHRCAAPISACCNFRGRLQVLELAILPPEDEPP